MMVVDVRWNSAFMVSVVAASHRLRLPALLLECVEPGDGNELDLLTDDFDGNEEGEQDNDDEDDDPTPFSVSERLNKRRTWRCRAVRPSG
jgi:hypothetical protein